jgi:hypothetical protein
MNWLRIDQKRFWQVMALAAGSKLVPISLVLGSGVAYFTATNMVGPLATLCGGLFGGLFYSVLGFFLAGKSSLILNTGLPHLLAGQYLRSQTLWFKIGLPAICMLLFWLNPVGLAAAWYATFWFIPMVIAYFAPRGLFWQALGATFTAHAVGSVIWLYFAAPMLPAQWLSLMTIVPVERICLAAGMVAVYQVTGYIARFGSMVIQAIGRKLKA